ncbi:MAG: S1 RNA-binding domain-containing protein [Lentisphaeria bacterium]|nr:S1 RNA-binding domain-containing protein [Lentisphaeria bacterium]
MADNSGGAMDFGAYLDNGMDALKRGFEVGEQVTGTVTLIDRNSVFLDINARSEGIIDRSEFVDGQGNISVKVGDSVTAYFISAKGGEFKLAMSYGAKGDKAGLWDAYQGGIPIEGRVDGERAGGYEVTIAGQKGFCPYSQIDIHRQDPAAYIGEKFRFKITEYDEWGDNLVVSRRQLLEVEREQQQKELQDSLKIGDVMEGRVTKLMDFGAFVDIGGVEGLIPISQLAWGRVNAASDVVSEGEKVKVAVLNIDWAKGRITLSLKEAQGNPWESVGETYAVGRKVKGVVTKLMPFGAFVALEPGVEGLVHISKLGAGRRINHPKEVVEEGQTVEVEIESIDLDARKMSLSMESNRGGQTGAENDTEAAPQPVGQVVVGGRVTGVVQGIKHFGVFVSLPGDHTGLLHISQVDYKGGRDVEGWLRVNMPEGSQIDVVIEKMDGDRISLTTAEKWDKENNKEDISGFMIAGDDGALGSLGDALGKLNL